MVPFRSYLIPNINTPKQLAKKLKNTIMASFRAKIGWKRPRKSVIKIIVPFHSYLKRNRKFHKNS